LIPRAADDRLVANCYASYLFFVSAEAPQLYPSFDVPHSYRVIPRATDDQFTVCADSHARHFGLMAAQQMPFYSSLVPHTYRVEPGPVLLPRRRLRPSAFGRRVVWRRLGAVVPPACVPETLEHGRRMTSEKVHVLSARLVEQC